LLSIGLFARHSKNKNVVDTANRVAGTRRVLPHVLRKPARAFNRLLAGNVVISRREWVTMLTCLTVASSVAIFGNSHQGNSIVAEMSANMGFTIEAVEVEGIDELSEADILSRLHLERSKSLFTFDINHARASLRKLAWVRDAVVAKSYPDRLIVRIIERQPFGVWQDENTLTLVERDGETIDRFDEAFTVLPLLVGKGANVHGAQIVFLVGKVSILKNRVKAYVRIADRRWDLHLKNGITVRLPDEDPAAALSKLTGLDEAYNLLDRDLEVVDLRLGDRLVVGLSEGARQRYVDGFDKSKAAISSRGSAIPTHRGEKI
jgi:cell division protein FtsQ